MKFSIEKDYLLSILLFSQGISEHNNINSYYSFLVIKAENNKLIFQSADRQSTFEHSAEPDEENNISIESIGSVLIPLVKISTIAQNLPDGIISFVFKNDNAIIQPKDNPSEISFSVRTRTIEDYPTIHKDMPEDTYEISGDSLYEIIQKTSFASSIESRDSTMFLTGIFFETQDDFLIAVATDRNRISISKTKVNFSFPNTYENDIIVPSKTMNIIKKFSSMQENVLLALDDNRMYFKTNNTCISANLISGKYYDYRKIVPTKERNRITVNKEILKTALNRVSVIGDNKKNIAVKFDIQEDMLFISSEEKEKGTSSEKISINLKGNTGLFAVKSQFIYDPLQVVETEDVIIDYGNEKRDLIKIISTNEDSNTIHITAPYNI